MCRIEEQAATPHCLVDGLGQRRAVSIMTIQEANERTQWLRNHEKHPHPGGTKKLRVCWVKS